MPKKRNHHERLREDAALARAIRIVFERRGILLVLPGLSPEVYGDRHTEGTFAHELLMEATTQLNACVHIQSESRPDERWPPKKPESVWIHYLRPMGIGPGRETDTAEAFAAFEAELRAECVAHSVLLILPAASLPEVSSPVVAFIADAAPTPELMPPTPPIWAAPSVPWLTSRRASNTAPPAWNAPAASVGTVRVPEWLGANSGHGDVGHNGVLQDGWYPLPDGIQEVDEACPACFPSICFVRTYDQEVGATRCAAGRVPYYLGTNFCYRSGQERLRPAHVIPAFIWGCHVCAERPVPTLTGNLMPCYGCGYYTHVDAGCRGLWPTDVPELHGVAASQCSADELPICQLCDAEPTRYERDNAESWKTVREGQPVGPWVSRTTRAKF